MEYAPKHNYKCFAIHNSECSVTTRKNCIGCNFFKTKEEFEEDARHSFYKAKDKGYYPNIEKYEEFKED